MIEYIIGFIFGTFLMLPIFRNEKNFYLFLIELIRKRIREKKIRVKEVNMNDKR